MCRNAGNIADAVVLGTLEYGVIELGSPLIMVVGHEGCVAVSSTSVGAAALACRAAKRRLAMTVNCWYWVL